MKRKAMKLPQQFFYRNFFCLLCFATYPLVFTLCAINNLRPTLFGTARNINIVFYAEGEYSVTCRGHCAGLDLLIYVKKTIHLMRQSFKALIERQNLQNM
jgi:hypothetical protein